jgi:hypothetical protein
VTIHKLIDIEYVGVQHISTNCSLVLHNHYHVIPNYATVAPLIMEHGVRYNLAWATVYYYIQPLHKLLRNFSTLYLLTEH